MALFWRASLFLTIISFCNLEICEGSTTIRNPTSVAHKSDSSVVVNQAPVEETCKFVTCLPYFIKYYQEVLMGLSNYQVTTLEPFGYPLDSGYFQHFQPIPVSLIKQAFEACKEFGYETLDGCRQFFNIFLKKSCPIELISEMCRFYRPACVDPANNLILTYQEMKELITVEKLNFITCMEMIKPDDRQVLDGNLEYARMLKNRQRTTKISNKCD